MAILDLILKPSTRNKIKFQFTKNEEWKYSYKTWRIVSSTNGKQGVLECLGKIDQCCSPIVVYFIENGLGDRQIVSFDYIKGNYADLDASRIINFSALCNGFVNGLSHDTLNRMLVESNRTSNFDKFTYYEDSPIFEDF